MNRIVSIMLVLTLLLPGCDSSPKGTARDYVQAIKKSGAGSIEKVPEIAEIEIKEYTAVKFRSPFEKPQKVSATIQEPILVEEEPEPLNLVEQMEEDAVFADSFHDDAFQLSSKPDAGRRLEILEYYPLDSLTMIGTLSKDNYYWGFVMDTSGIVHRVEIGNHMGENSGKIVKISDDEMEIEELVYDEIGNWVTRPVKVTIETVTN